MHYLSFKNYKNPVLFIGFVMATVNEPMERDCKCAVGSLPKISSVLNLILNHCCSNVCIVGGAALTLSAPALNEFIIFHSI